MPDPFKQIIQSIDARIAGKSSETISALAAELGTITASGIRLDSFRHELPDYLIADWLVRMQLPGESVDDVRLDFRAGLSPGDRVLAIPVNRGRDVVVICKVVSN